MITEGEGKVARYWSSLQPYLFGWMREEVGAHTDKHFEVIRVLEVSRIEEFVMGHRDGDLGRPPCERKALARAFVAKSVLNIGITEQLIDRLKVDVSLRRICGFERRQDVPSSSTFSRAFQEFALSSLPSRVHDALVRRELGDVLIGHVCRDGTEIKARERLSPKKEPPPAKKYPKGRPRKGEVRPPKEPSRVARQLAGMTLDAMLEELPKQCDTGCKRNSNGYLETWRGYKLHVDTIDGDIPVSCVLTSASVHDSQVAIPLATMTAGKITSLYDLMDSAYDSPEIRQHSHTLGHKPIIEVNPRRGDAFKKEHHAEEERLRLIRFELPEQVRFKIRTSAERTNSRLKDDYAGRIIRVRGHAKVFAHLMFGVLALAVDRIVAL